MNPFAIFVTCYATAFLMEMLEKWKYPGFSLAALGLVTFVVFTRITKLKFLIFLILTSAYFLIWRFPDVANHVNLIIYLNISLIIGGIYSYFLPRDRASSYPSQDEAYFEMMLPILRVSLILVYFLAGFHKFNQDFFNPQVSCARDFLLRIVSVVELKFLGLSLFFWLTIILLITFWHLVAYKLTIFNRNKQLTFGLLITIIPLAWLVSVMVQTNPNLLSSLLPLLSFLTAIVVVTWEMLGGSLLTIAKLQLPILFFSLLMHLILAPIGFVDFGALAIALLFTFIPHNYYQLLIKNINMTVLGRNINRVHVYFLFNTSAGIFAGINYLFYPLPNLRIFTGFLFCIAAIILIYPLLSVILLPASQRPSWQGVSVFKAKIPKFLLFFPLFLLIFGFSSYLGLGTAGNFSMFSNLKTEGRTSNHFLLSQNPFKIFDYQEDIVEIHIAFNDKGQYLTLNNRPLQGHYLPMIEFKKLIYDLTKDNRKIAIEFKYRDQVYQTRDIINDPIWKTSKQNWEMKLMNFRLISPVEPNECRW